MTSSHRSPLSHGLLLAAALATAGASQAQDARPRTLEVQYAGAQYTAGLPDARGFSLAAVAPFSDGQVLRADLLQEKRFGLDGGVVAGTYTRVLSPEAYVTATLALGHGGPNWARQRIDLDLANKWGAARSIVTHVAVNGARFDGDRSDQGLRTSVVAYLDGPLGEPLVLEGGVMFNISRPGSVHSSMPYLGATWGRVDEQTFALRITSGRESYQALGAAAQLVDFHSRSVGLTWRRWMDPTWGFVAGAETYRNPSYRRHTAGGGLMLRF